MYNGVADAMSTLIASNATREFAFVYRVALQKLFTALDNALEVRIRR